MAVANVLSTHLVRYENVLMKFGHFDFHEGVGGSGGGDALIVRILKRVVGLSVV